MIFLFVFILHAVVCPSAISWTTDGVPTNTLYGNLDCNFEAGFCGYTQVYNDNYDWTRHSGSTGNGLSYDHTNGTSYGYYVYIAYGSAGKTARLQSPSLHTHSSHCVEFYYYMYGSSIGSLKVYAQTSGLGSPIWSMYGSQDDQWLLGQIQIDVYQTTQIVFEGDRGYGYGDIALDDIQIETGGCLGATDAPTDELTAIYGYLDCNFEAGFCGYTQRANPNNQYFLWTRISGSSTSSSTGPSYDHTYGTSYGYYISTETASVYKQIAYLYSPPLQTYDSHCVQFYYHMYGSSIGRLQVSTTKPGHGYTHWSTYGSHCNQWQHHQVQFIAYDIVQIKFTAIRGTSNSSVIALDDIQVKTGQCSAADWTTYETTTALSSIQSTDASTDELTTSGDIDGIRLRSGSYYDGRVEVLYNGEWGTVCHDYWDIDNADVACKQLGFASASAFYRDAYYCQGYGRIWMDNVQCSGYETSLSNCYHSGFGIHNCDHSQDVSVRCQTGLTTNDMTTETPSTTFTDDFTSDDIMLHCGPSTFQVDIPKRLVENSVHARDLYIGGDPYNVTCQGFSNGDYIILNSSLTGCGTTYTDNQTLSFYQNMIRHTVSDIVVYLAIEIPIVCEYDRSKRLMSHFKTISNVIKKQERGSFDFDFAMYTDITYTQRHYTYPVVVTLGSKLYFRTELQQAPENLEIHLRSCRATPTSTFSGPVIYEFIRNGCGVNSASVRVLTPEIMTQADFEIASFRFTQDLGNESSQIWIHCEVVVCDVNDANTECRQGCEVSRHRRSVQGPYQEAARIVQGPFILPIENEEKFEKLILNSKKDEGNYVSNVFIASVSVVFLFMLLVLVIMGMALMVFMRKARQPTYQPLPNPVGATYT